jgi:hypothetical protein
MLPIERAPEGVNVEVGDAVLDSFETRTRGLDRRAGKSLLRDVLIQGLSLVISSATARACSTRQPLSQSKSPVAPVYPDSQVWAWHEHVHSLHRDHCFLSMRAVSVLCETRRVTRELGGASAADFTRTPDSLTTSA